MDRNVAPADDAAIRALVERCAQGFRDLDVDAIMACHAEDVVCFDLHSRFEARGAPAMRAFLSACMPHMRAPVVHEVHALSVAAGGDLALAHFHVRSACRDKSGAEHAGWMRATLGLRRTAGGWRISHAHVSAPFDPLTNRTMFGLPREAAPWTEASQCPAC